MTSMLTNPVFKETDPYLANFERLETGPASSLPLWVHALHKTGISHFAELGFPTTQHEEWRSTNVQPISQMPFKPALSSPRHGLTLQAISPHLLAGLSCHRLVFLDGHFAPALSSVGTKPPGVKICSLASALTIDHEMIEHHLAHHAAPGENAFTALNTAFFQDGAFVLLPPGAVLPEPIHLLFISLNGETGTASHPRNLVIAQKHSQAKIIEHYVNGAEGAYLTNTVSELILGEGAILEHAKIQNESPSAYHIATLRARLEHQSRFISHSLSFGARLSRHNLHVVLAAEQGECLLNGLYLATGEQVVDHHTVIDHAKPRCNSHEFYHGILDQRARGVFSGKIFVRPEAQKTDAKQTNRNLLLSEDATIDTKPQLEIFADDVKCTHGATVGQLDEEAVFYLRASGLGAREAKQLLLRAFGTEIVNRVSGEAFKIQLNALLQQSLATMHINGEPA